MVADVYKDDTLAENFGRIGNTPFEVYWDSHFAYHEYSTISDLGTVYTSLVHTFYLQVRDREENKYNVDTHEENLDRAVYVITLIGDEGEPTEASYYVVSSE